MNELQYFLGVHYALFLGSVSAFNADYIVNVYLS